MLRNLVNTPIIVGLFIAIVYNLKAIIHECKMAHFYWWRERNRYSVQTTGKAWEGMHAPNYARRVGVQPRDDKGRFMAIHSRRPM